MTADETFDNMSLSHRPMPSILQVVAVFSMHLTVLDHTIATADLSVCQSRSDVLSRRMKVRSCGFQYQVVQSF